MRLDNSNSWSHCSSFMEEKLTVVIRSLSYIHFIKMSFMYSFSFTLASSRAFQVRFSTINYSTNFITLQWPHCRFCGTQYMILNTKKIFQLMNISKIQAVIKFVKMVVNISTEIPYYSESAWLTHASVQNYCFLG